MERGVYFDAWFPRQHCYHPSLPPRRLRMVEHLREFRATSLVWSALGGGSISLPFLEQEAYGAFDARSRFYGFVNDSEFIAEAQRHGIKVFGIVFEVQGWEFPVELNEDESEILAINELRGVGKRGWLGLREFSQNRYPKLWPAFETYFPDGLTNSDGERVTDLLEECCSRDIHGTPLHARWVECPDREHYSYLMDRNNPVWREYLKAIVRIQVDAGVAGVQLDEAELPITALQYGGCFCKDCMKGFRAYLQGRGDDLPGELRGADLERFHYGEFLLERGRQSTDESAPLFHDYLAFQRGQITRYFAEIARYAKEYARSQGREVLVSGNFFNLFDHYYALEPEVDMVITEMRNTRYRQPAWYRYVAGFSGDKPTIVVENPYGGVVPELVDMLARGKGYDLFRMSLYEAAALGANMSVPYGAWMGSVIEDSFTPPHDLCVEIQTFLGENEELFSRRTDAEVAIVFSVESTFRAAAAGVMADNRENVAEGGEIPFWQALEAMCEARQPVDVVFFPDGELRPDSLRPGDLDRYRTLVLPDCRHLTEPQASALEAYLDGGGRAIVTGALGANLPADRGAALAAHAGVVRADRLDVGALPDGPQVVVEGGDDLALNLQRLDDGSVALHVIRYGYDAGTDAVPALAEASFAVRLPTAMAGARATSPAGEVACELGVDGDVHRVTLRDLPIYTVAVLSPAR